MKILHKMRLVQILLGLLFGLIFGFLLQKGGVTKYDVIVGQLQFTDYTVIKIMLTAIVVGMFGIHLLKSFNKINFAIKPGSIGQVCSGGLIFGIGFGLLGYCPGTLMGALGEGAMDAAIGGIIGIIFGSWIFALCYPYLAKTVFKFGDFKDLTLPKLLHINRWAIVIPLGIGIISFLYFLHIKGL